MRFRLWGFSFRIRFPGSNSLGFLDQPAQERNVDVGSETMRPVRTPLFAPNYGVGMTILGLK